MPLCGKIPDVKDGDTIHPSGAYWRPHKEIGKIYVGPKERLDTDGTCWVIRCLDLAGGCDAEMHGGSIEEVIAKWLETGFKLRDISIRVQFPVFLPFFSYSIT